jgi:predicted membrane chloride channel (bestrophin family)
MLIFALGLMVGTALGIVVVGFLAVRAYDHGYDEALERRKAWRGELVARQTAAVRAQRSDLKRAS